MANAINDKLAVLIDADNAQASLIHELLAEVSCYGTASVKRAYGDRPRQRMVGTVRSGFHARQEQPLVRPTELWLPKA